MRLSIYRTGTLSYMMSVRRREVGLRLALGAPRGQIVKQFLGRRLAVALTAALAGLGLSLGFARLLTGMLYGVSLRRIHPRWLQ